MSNHLIVKYVESISLLVKQEKKQNFQFKVHLVTLSSCYCMTA